MGGVPSLGTLAGCLSQAARCLPERWGPGRESRGSGFLLSGRRVKAPVCGTRTSEGRRAWEGQGRALVSPEPWGSPVSVRPTAPPSWARTRARHSSAHGQICRCPRPRSTRPTLRPVRTAPWRQGDLLWKRLTWSLSRTLRKRRSLSARGHWASVRSEAPCLVLRSPRVVWEAKWGKWGSKAFCPV